MNNDIYRPDTGRRTEKVKCVAPSLGREMKHGNGDKAKGEFGRHAVECRATRRSCDD